jgi:penicillin V acylase-like amidase (Ntn superfamily)
MPVPAPSIREGALVVTGRTMNWRSAMPTNLWALPVASRGKGRPARTP